MKRSSSFLSHARGYALLFCVLTLPFRLSAQYELTYDEPATVWEEALPLGNGSIGAMVYGGVSQEHIQFNEETLWTGKPHDYSNKGSHKYLGEIRRLLSEGSQREAEQLAMEKFMSIPLGQMTYQPFGDLMISFPGHEKYQDYSRKLDLATASCRVNYLVDGVAFTREIFVSSQNRLLVVHLEAGSSGALNFDWKLDSRHFLKSIHTQGDWQGLTVQIPDGVLMGHATARVVSDGKVTRAYDKVSVSQATSATIYLSAFTNFKNYQEVGGNPVRQAERAVAGLTLGDFATLREKHVEKHQSLYKRFKIRLGPEELVVRDHTDERIRKFWKEANDPSLLALYVQYGRYLLISSSRPGTQPANLQGIWNEELNPPWDSKYTTNINAEMNYWPAELTNLSECHEPLFQMIKDLSLTGSLTAREHYDCKGWVFHHNTDIWRGAAPINHSNHGIWVTGGAWLCSHLWEHYLYTRDLDFLREYYPVMKGAAQFFTEFLVEDPRTGYLISTPSNSPEIGGLVAGPAMDHQIIRALFRSCIKASELLSTDSEFADELQSLLPKIAPSQIGKHGQLQEWMEDKDDPNNHHRHVSHLWAVHPGNEINWEESPELMKAARQSLIYRGDEGTGWSLAWKINFWSRFLEGDRAYDLVQMLLSPAEEPGRRIRGGSYPNLMDAHPPFQIDGNFGGAAGIVEMLMQSHLGHIDLLPALPAALPEGEISGLCARGGFELSFAWEGGKLIRVSLLSKAGEPCTLRYGDREVQFKTKAGEVYTFDSRLKKI